jgi:hypothetical protein
LDFSVEGDVSAHEFVNLLPLQFIWAMLIYVCFRYADGRIGAGHKEAFSEWLQKTRAYERDARAKKQIQEAIRKGILELFDRLYILPFSTPAADPDSPAPTRKLGTRAFVISAIITTFITANLTILVILLDGSKAGVESQWNILFDKIFYSMKNNQGLDFAFRWGVPVNIIFDYLALYVIRSWLDTPRVTPRQALLFGPLAGILLVLSCVGVRLVVHMIGIIYWNDDLYQHFPHSTVCISPAGASSLTYVGSLCQEPVQKIFGPLFNIHWPSALAALIVHLWLPLVAFCVFLLRTAGFFHRFLGEKHPLEAIGIAAAIVVFVVPWVAGWVSTALAPVGIWFLLLVSLFTGTFGSGSPLPLD